MRRVNEITRELKDRYYKHRECLRWLRDNYWGFSDLEYDVAVIIGDIDCFESEDRSLVDVGGRLIRCGVQYKYIFMDRVNKYFNSRRNLLFMVVV